METVNAVDTIFDSGVRLLEQDAGENVTYSKDCVRIGFVKFVKWYYYVQKTQGFCKADIFAIESIFEKFEDEQKLKNDFIVTAQDARKLERKRLEAEAAAKQAGEDEAKAAEAKKQAGGVEARVAVAVSSQQGSKDAFGANEERGQNALL